MRDLPIEAITQSTLGDPSPCERSFASLRVTNAKRSSFLNNLGVLEHRDPTALNKFAFERDRFAAGIGELVVHRLVFANDNICLAVFNDPDGSAVFDALRATGLSVTIAHCAMIDIAHHVDYLAGHRFFSYGIRLSMFVVRQRQRGGCK